MNPCIVIQIWK